MLIGFDRFLRRRNLYDAFLYNIEHCSNTYKRLRGVVYSTPLEFYNLIKEYPYPITIAFTWNKTKEGESFWNELSSEYANHILTYSPKFKYR